MIRINLLNNIGAGTTASAKAAEGVVYDEVSKKNANSVWLKVVLIVAVPYALFQYESNHLTGLQERLVVEQETLAQLDKEIQEMGAAVELVKQFKEKKRMIEERIGVIAELSRSRLDEVFALDNLQTLIPDRMWLIGLTVEGRKMSIKGIAVSETEITDLIKNLEDSVFFNDVVFTSTVERKTDEGALQEFEVNCVLETI